MIHPFLRMRMSLALISLISSAGCYTSSRDYRLEQVLPAGEHVYLVVSTGTTRSYIDGPTVLRDQRYLLLAYDPRSSRCPPIRPTEVRDGSVGLGPIDQRPDRRVDFLMGAYPGRAVRIVSERVHDRPWAHVAVLGRNAPSGRWTLLWSRDVEDPYGAAGLGISTDGRYVAFGSPARVLDTGTLAEVTPGDLPGRLREQYARTTTDWDDCRVRWADSQTGSVTSSTPVWCGWRGPTFYAWDADKHKPIPWPEGPPPCDGLAVAIHPRAGETTLNVLDVATPMRERGFDQVFK